MKIYNAVEFYSTLSEIVELELAKTYENPDRSITPLEHLPYFLSNAATAMDKFFAKPSSQNWDQLIEKTAECSVLFEQFQMILSEKDRKQFDRVCLQKAHQRLEFLKQQREFDQELEEHHNGQ